MAPREVKVVCEAPRVSVGQHCSGMIQSQLMRVFSWEWSEGKRETFGVLSVY